jgi:hypothetical protein
MVAGVVVIDAGAPDAPVFAPPAVGAVPLVVVVAMPPGVAALPAAPAVLDVGLAPVEPAAAVVGCVAAPPGVTPVAFPLSPPQAEARPNEIDKLHRNKLRIVGSCYSLHTANRARARNGAMT